MVEREEMALRYGQEPNETDSLRSLYKGMTIRHEVAHEKRNQDSLCLVVTVGDDRLNTRN